MSLFRYKGSEVWTVDFYVNGVRIRESTGMTCKTRAREVHDKRKQGLKDGLAGIKKQQQPNLRSVASEEWLEMKKTTLASRSVAIKKGRPSAGPELRRCPRHFPRYRKTRRRSLALTN